MLLFGIASMQLIGDLLPTMCTTECEWESLAECCESSSLLTNRKSVTETVPRIVVSGISRDSLPFVASELRPETNIRTLNLLL